MALQESLIKLKGTLGDLAFYKTEDGYLARRKGGISAFRIKNDPAYVRVRENGAEFARAGKAARLIRLAFRSQIMQVADKRMTGRLTKELIRVIQADATNPRGLRNVIDGEAALLEGFEFNESGRLTQSILAPFTTSVNRSTGSVAVNLESFIPQDLIVSPAGSTHCKVIVTAAEIDFENGTHVVASSESDFIALNNVNQPAISLTQSVTAGSTHPIFLAMGIMFFQQVNTQFYPLKNGANNALAFVKVDGLA